MQKPEPRAEVRLSGGFLRRVRVSAHGSGALGLLVVAAALATGMGPLADNSLFTHLSTGRLLWDGTIPRTDPYTFTAAGEPWIAQSWLVSLAMGALEDLVGLGAVRILFALLGAGTVALCWLLTAPARTPLLRLLVVVPVAVLAATGWAQRPFLVAFAALAALLLVLDGRWRPPVLVPVLWVWVNSHGSWPFAVAVVAAYWIGARLDGGDAARERATARWVAIGLAASVVNPYRARIFTVPLEALERTDIFSHIQEWQPPRYDTPFELAFLALVVAGSLLALSRGATWRDTLPLVGFLLAALYSMRNIAPAAIVAVPSVSRILGARASWGALRVPARPVLALAAALAVLAGVRLVTIDHLSDDGYPADATLFLVEEGLDPRHARVVAREYVGNYFEVVFGTDARVFVDDRFEVMPAQVAEDYLELLAAGPDWQEALDRYEPAAVLWEADAALAQVLDASPAWEVAYRDEDFVVALPRG